MEYNAKDREVKKSIRSDKRKWVENLANEAERAADNGQMKTLYEITRAICNEKSRQASGGVKNKQGKIITDDKGIQTRWKEHFDEVFNKDTPSNPVEI